MPKILLNPKENMMNCARNLLKEKGSEKFNIRDVSKDSGVSIGTIYNYYGDKFGLLLAVLDQEWEDASSSILEKAKNENDYGGVVSIIYHGVAEYMAIASAAFNLYIKDGKFGLEGYEEKKSVFVDRIANLLEAGIASIGGEMCHAPCCVLALGIIESISKGNIPEQPLMRLALGIETLHKNQ